MTAPRVRSSLRRLSAPAGALLLACLVLPATAPAAPSPDPPPLPVAPDPAPGARPAAPAQGVSAAPAVSVPERPAQAAPEAQARRPVQRQAPVRAPVTRARVAPAPHDRTPLPLVRAAERAEQALDRTLLVLAGIALLLVASGGAVGLLAVRRELEGRLA